MCYQQMTIHRSFYTLARFMSRQQANVPQLGQNEHEFILAVILQLQANVVLNADNFEVVVQIQHSEPNVEIIALEEPQKPRIGRLRDCIGH
jgi:hypothetical protein